MNMEIFKLAMIEMERDGKSIFIQLKPFPIFNDENWNLMIEKAITIQKYLIIQERNRKIAQKQQKSC